jgi:hypothetical protein
MKKILLLILISFLYSCDKKEKKVESMEKESIETAYEKNKTFVDLSSERVALLAIAKGIPGDSLKLILTDYYTQTYVLDTITVKDSERIVSSIAEKFHISKPKIASLIYNFEYEMLTSDEIFEREFEKKQSASGEYE